MPAIAFFASTADFRSSSNVASRCSIIRRVSSSTGGSAVRRLGVVDIELSFAKPYPTLSRNSRRTNQDEAFTGRAE
jgi:hypothetical protein